MITLKFVDLEIETPLDIQCDYFETSFPDFKTQVINETNKINQILCLLNDAKTAGKDYYQHVDTRIKIELKYTNDSIESICMDNFIFSRNDHLLIVTDSLKTLLTFTE